MQQFLVQGRNFPHNACCENCLILPNLFHQSAFLYDVFPQSSAIIKTGVCIELPPNTVGFLKSKSGLNVKHSLTTEGVIDEGYTGEIVVKVYNNSNDLYTFYRGDKITQLVVLPCLYESIEIVDEIEGKERGNNGFGSTGK